MNPANKETIHQTLDALRDEAEKRRDVFKNAQVPKIHIGMAKAFHELGMSRETKSHYQKSLQLIKNKQDYDFSWIWEGSDAQAFYDLASYQALLNHPQEALDYLKKAIDCGWADLPQLENDECFHPLCDLPEYKKFIQGMN